MYVDKHIIWTPRVGERLETFCEEDNEYDKYAVAVHLDNCATVVACMDISQGK